VDHLQPDDHPVGEGVHRAAVIRQPVRVGLRKPRPGGVTAWFAGQHLRRQISYQPASRFWQLQAEETGILLAISLALAGATTWKSGTTTHDHGAEDRDGAPSRSSALPGGSGKPVRAYQAGFVG
jgi:hypothetical protein